MAWLTKITTDEQVEYRLHERAGCDLLVEEQTELAEGTDRVLDYRLRQEGETPLVWMGSGLEAVGLSAGQVLDEAGKDMARRLMNGCHPLTGARLTTSRNSVRAHPESKLTVARVLKAIDAAAAEKGVEAADLLEGKPKQQRLLAQQQRMVHRRGEGHRLQVATLKKLAGAAGVDLADVFTPEELAKAHEHRDERVESRTRGFDLVLDIPKSDSVLAGLLPEDAERQYRELVHQASREALAQYEKWIAYSVGGEDGEMVRLATGGLLAWSTEHRSARPIGDGTPGDPHLHLHISIANMALCEDGKWRSIAARGRDMYRHASAIDGYFKARLRALTHEHFGVRREQAEKTGAWEVDGIPASVRDAYSRRAKKVEEIAGEGASREEMARASAATRRAKHATGSASMRASWRERAETMGVDVEEMLAAAAPGPPGPGGAGIDPAGGGPRIPPPADLARVVFHPETGLTATRKDFDRAQLLAAVVNALPYGIGADPRALDRLADDVLRVEGYAVALPHMGPTFMSSTDRYTTRDILQAEDAAITQARTRYGDASAVLTATQAQAARNVFEVAAGFTLSQEQVRVVDRLLTAGHGIDAVVGVAGAGKSTLMDTCRIAWDATGTTYAGACLSAVGAQGLQDASAIPSRTVASWLKRIETGSGLSGIDVLVLDEAAMTDDRSAARLLTEAARTGTKLIAIGDPKQLQAVGVGGWFAEVHRLVDGELLTENRRQENEAERAALEVWRTGDHRAALDLLAAGGRVHPADTAADARSQILMTWQELRTRWPDELDLLENLTVLAARNLDVDALNLGAQQLRRVLGELGTEHTYALPGGDQITLAEGDVVRVRANDYRSQRGAGPDVLNGYRGVITTIAEDRSVEITWRTKDRFPDGTLRTESAWMSPDDIAAGKLSLGYAMTVAASQGMTCDTSLLYGHGANAFAAYPGLTRGRTANHIWLPLDVVESERTQEELGAARTDTERLDRAVHAFATYLGQSRPDSMVSDELRPTPEPVTAPVPHQVRLDQARQDAHAAAEQARRTVSARAARARSTTTKSPLQHSAETEAGRGATPAGKPPK
ncbi:MobF family relaxase [Streptomyces cinereoruber]|uniref:MobF family relaxase n=1 Tax=Streptomyces cinereoruber TaxID=67260 RepID=UPI003C2FF27A